jgi:hypothetical protein
LAAKLTIVLDYVTRFDENLLIAKNGQDKGIVIHGKFAYPMPIFLCVLDEFSIKAIPVIKAVTKVYTNIEKSTLSAKA